MIKKIPSLVLAIIVLSLQVIITVILFVVAKLGDSLAGLIMAIWTWPLFFLGLISLVFSLVSLRKEDYKKKAIVAIILSGSTILLFAFYAIMLGFFVGTGHLLLYYL